MVERAAVPPVPTLTRRVLATARALTTPAVPDAYLALINPMWSTRELLGVVQEVRHETPDTATIVIRPSRPWPGHQPGQYLRVGVEINGIRHWRAFTLTSDPGHPKGVVALTVKIVADGLMSNYLLREATRGTILFLGQVEGDFVLNERPTEPLLFVSAGSGVTPLFALLRQLEQQGWVDDVVHVFCVRTEQDVIFGRYLEQLAERFSGYRLITWLSSRDGRLMPAGLQQLAPDWQKRRTYLSAPPDMITAFKAFWGEHDRLDRLELERFQPKAGADIEPGRGGSIRFRVSDATADCDGSTPILVAGEQAGLELQYGCRMGICHTCVGRLADGRVRDLRSGDTSGTVGETIRICISCPEGHVEVDL